MVTLDTRISIRIVQVSFFYHFHICNIFLMCLIALAIELSVIQSDSKLLSWFPWTINGNSDNNLESLCISMASLGVTL
jgi:hypothetical protein